MSLTIEETRDDLDDDQLEERDTYQVDEEDQDENPAPVQTRATPTEAEPAEAETGTKISAKDKAKLNRAAYRKGAAKAIELVSASGTALTILAELTTSSEDPAELAAAVLSAPRGITQPLDDINELSTAIVENPLAAGLTAVSWGSARIKAVWGVLYAVGELEVQRVPAADVKAAMAIIEPVGSLSDKIREALDEASALSARS